MLISKKSITIAAGAVVLSTSLALAQTATTGAAMGTSSMGASSGAQTGETGSANGSQAGMTRHASPTNSAPDSTGTRGATPSGAAAK